MCRQEERCLFVGGPYDGEILAVERECKEWTLPNYALSMREQWKAAILQMEAEVSAGHLATSEEDMCDRFEELVNQEREQYAEPAAGGVLYRRDETEPRLHYVKRLSAEELSEWKRKNTKVIKRSTPPQFP